MVVTQNMVILQNDLPVPVKVIFHVSGYETKESVQPMNNKLKFLFPPEHIAKVKTKAFTPGNYAAPEVSLLFLSFFFFIFLPLFKTLFFPLFSTLLLPPSLFLQIRVEIKYYNDCILAIFKTTSNAKIEIRDTHTYITHKDEEGFSKVLNLVPMEKLKSCLGFQ